MGLELEQDKRSRGLTEEGIIHIPGLYSRWVRLANGAKAHYVTSGESGPAVILLHGGIEGSSGTAGFRFMCNFLGARGFRVYAPDRPGFGKSDMPDWLDDIHDLVFFYLDFLAHEGLAGVHLVGNSLGGWLAAEIAMTDAARLKTLTLVSPAGIHVKGVQKADIFLWSPEEQARHLFHDPALAEAEAKRAADPAGEDLRMKNRFATARLAWQPRFYDPLLMKWLKRVTLPTLCGRSGLELAQFLA